MLFRLAAYGEAVGWTLLIAGIIAERYIVPGNHVPVLFVGQIHGTLFFGYMLASMGLYPTLRWPRWQAIVALMASVPPYGSLIFEQWASRRRNADEFKTFQRCIWLLQFEKLNLH
ncbi:MAG: DUF3817 domain-containing protein [Candidatus Saccharimonadales bacterium]